MCFAEEMIDNAFPFWIAMFSLCFSHKDSRFSPVFSEMRLPTSLIMFLVEGPNTPEVSIAMGSNLNLLASSGYLVLLVFSAFAAAWPASTAVSFTELSAKVLTQVASQQRFFPWLKGKTVTPSGLFPSPRFSPTGSNVVANPADFSAREMMSYNVVWLGCLPKVIYIFLTFAEVVYADF